MALKLSSAALASLVLAPSLALAQSAASVEWNPMLRIDEGAPVTPTIVTVNPPAGQAPTAPSVDIRGIASIRTVIPGQGTFICSGALLPSRRHVLTAAHCITRNGTIPAGVTVSAQFGGTFSAPVETVSAANLAFNPLYTGVVQDGADVAVITLSREVTNWGDGYDLFDGDAVGQNYEVHGYGRNGTLTNGAPTNNAGTRGWGFNRFDFSGSDPLAAAYMNAATTANRGGILYADADNAANTAMRPILDWNAASTQVAPGSAELRMVGTTDASCWVNALFCDAVGRGLDEVSTAGGDSGGPSFIGGRIAGVTSFGSVRRCFVEAPNAPNPPPAGQFAVNPAVGDITQYFRCGFSPNPSPSPTWLITSDNNAALNSSFGEFNGIASVAWNRQWILSVTAVPEPSTYAMLATGLLGLGLVARRRRK